MQTANVICSDDVIITLLQLTSLQACKTRLSRTGITLCQSLTGAGITAHCKALQFLAVSHRVSPPHSFQAGIQRKVLLRQRYCSPVDISSLLETHSHGECGGRYTFSACSESSSPEAHSEKRNKAESPIGRSNRMAYLGLAKPFCPYKFSFLRDTKFLTSGVSFPLPKLFSFL